MQLSDNRKAAGAGLVLALVTLLAYWHLLQNGFISYDDTRYLFENEHVRPGLTLDGVVWSLTSRYDGNWFPLTWISHMIDVSLFGFNPMGHHLVSLMLHIANTLLLLFILYRTTGFVWRSAAVAALFALHPLHVESVAWAAERKDVLSTLFFMLTVLAYTRYAGKRTLPRYLAVLLLFACGLASKPMLVSLPLVLLLLDLWPLERLPVPAGALRPWLRDTLWPLVREKLPLMALAALSCLITLDVQKGAVGTLDVAHHSLAQNLLHALVNYGSYLEKTFWPVDLAVIYPYEEAIAPWQVALAGLFVLGLSWLALRQWRSRSYLAVGWFWFLITLVPVIGLVKVGEQSIADRYTYLPLIGIFISLVWLVSEFLQRTPRLRVAAAVGSLLLFGLLAEGTWQESGYWRDSFTLFDHTIQVTRDNYVAHTNLGSELMKYGRAAEAVPHFRESVRLNPQNPEVHYNLGVALDTLGDEPGAIEELRTVLLMNPNLKEAHFYLGFAYAKSGNLKGALDEETELERTSPEMARTLKSVIDSYGSPAGAHHS